jgi:hypothetical protein
MWPTRFASAGMENLGMSKQRGRPKKPTPPWTPAEDALLGTMPDQEVARRLNRTLTAVWLRRHCLNLPAFGRRHKRRRWTAEMDALLGTRPDAAVAQQIGLSITEVFYRRQHLGIPAFCQGRPQKVRIPFSDDAQESVSAALPFGSPLST